MDVQDLSSNDARLLVLEMSVAALIAQLPSQSLGEVAGMLGQKAHRCENVR